jgi:hypothetical protein
MSIEAMKQALEVLEEINRLSIGENAIPLPGEIDAAMDDIRAAIEQAEKQEPVAWVYEWDGRKHLTFTDQRFVEQAHPHFNKSTPLYAAPRQWVGLTDEEILYEIPITKPLSITSFARSIEAKLKEKNHG